MTRDVVNVKMSEMDVVTDGKMLKTILGSCVGIILHDPARRVSGLAHVMLPRRHKSDTTIGKYADTAVPALLSLLTGKGSRPASLRALLIGGAQMFPLGNAALASIGDQNVAAAREALQELKVPIVYEDTGGTSGRSVTFDNASGEVFVRTLAAIERKGQSS